MLADADLERAANGVVWGALFNAGQACVGIERVYVEDAVHDEFVERVVAKVSKLRQGDDSGRYRRTSAGWRARHSSRSSSARSKTRSPTAPVR